MRKPIRTSIQFDLDTNALLFVEPGKFGEAAKVILHITPGGVRRGQQYSCYLDPEKALELARHLTEVANGT